MLKWLSTRHFPYHRDRAIGYPHRAVIGVGGNIGDVMGHFEKLFGYWQRSSRLDILECSPILRNPPFGYMDQPDFYNGAILVATPLDPFELLKYMLYTEKRFGRERSFANAPRTLDLDLIFYDNIKLNTRRLHLPHPQWKQRDSVVMPLAMMKGMKGLR